MPTKKPVLEREPRQAKAQQSYAALVSENLKLQRKICQQEALIISLGNRIKALEEDRKENRPVVHINANYGSPKDSAT